MSGLICLDWYDWNTIKDNLIELLFALSGLFCLDWYDWNVLSPAPLVLAVISRDWSVWIDTIETWLPGTASKRTTIVGIDLSGLIRLKRHKFSSNVNTSLHVGIDLSGLIRLKLKDLVIAGGYSSHVGIDLFGLIRLKPGNSAVVGVTNGLSGLICLDWYDWNPSTFFNTTSCGVKVGIDLSRFIRLKIIKGTAIEIPQ